MSSSCAMRISMQPPRRGRVRSCIICMHTIIQVAALLSSAKLADFALSRATKKGGPHSMVRPAPNRQALSPVSGGIPAQAGPGGAVADGGVSHEGEVRQPGEVHPGVPPAAEAVAVQPGAQH